MQAREETFVFRIRTSRKERERNEAEQSGNEVHHYGNEIRHKPYGCDDDNCHRCYWDALFGTRECKKRQKPPHESPEYVGKEEDKNDFLIDFEAPSASRTAAADETSLSDSWDDCLSFPFLQLPRELRLLVYEFSFPSSSCPTVIEFDRDSSPQQGYYPPPKKQREPRIRYNRYPNKRVNGGLVATCKIIHEEATPLLYKNVIFHPKDNEGLLPLFLQRQQDLARRSIQCIRLDLDLSEPKPQARFHWAVTCAQVSRLSSTLSRVEVQFRNQEDLPSQTMVKNTLRTLLKPLCKISSPKTLILPDDIPYQHRSALSESFRQAIEVGEKALAERRLLEAEAKILKAQEEEHEEDKHVKQDEVQDKAYKHQISEDWETLSYLSFDSDWEDLKGEYDEYKAGLENNEG